MYKRQDAKGAEGFVTGKHGGIEHTICYFPADALDKMKIGDQILIRAIGPVSYTHLDVYKRQTIR